MTFESSSYDAVFAAEAMRKYRMFKKKESKINARGKEKRRANYAERIFFFFHQRSDRASKTQITVSDSQP